MTGVYIALLVEFANLEGSRGQRHRNYRKSLVKSCREDKYLLLVVMS